MRNSAPMQDLTPNHYAIRFLLGEIAKMESQRETLIARLGAIDDVNCAEFRLGITRLGNLHYEIAELRHLANKYRKRNSPDLV